MKSLSSLVILIPPSLSDMSGLKYCLPEHDRLGFVWHCEPLSDHSLWLSVPGGLCEDSLPVSSRDLLFLSLGKMHPNLSWRHLFALWLETSFESLVSHCRTLSCSPTNSVRLRSLLTEWLSFGKNLTSSLTAPAGAGEIEIGVSLALLPVPLTIINLLSLISSGLLSLSLSIGSCKDLKSFLSFLESMIKSTPSSSQSVLKTLSLEWELRHISSDLTQTLDVAEGI